MAAAQRTKASEKQGVCKKLTTLLKKRYKDSVPKTDRTVLETILYAICLENASVAQADAACERLKTGFHDLNEVRVSSIRELETVFRDMDRPEWRALRIRAILHYIFEKQFSFDFEAVRRKTLELASKQLGKINDLSPFVRGYTLQSILGSHLVPVDEKMCNAAIWLGLVEPGSTPEQAADALKPVIRKADVSLFSHLLRSLACDSNVRKTFDAANRRAPEDGYDVLSAPERLADLLKQSDARAKKAAARKKAAGKGTKKKIAGQTAATRRSCITKTSKSAAKKKATAKNSGDPTKEQEKSKAAPTS